MNGNQYRMMSRKPMYLHEKSPLLSAVIFFSMLVQQSTYPADD